MVRVLLEVLSLDDAFYLCVSNIIWLLIFLFPCHFLITYAGFKFTEVQADGYNNEFLLDGLEEGMIILNLQTQKVSYHNKAVEFLLISDPDDN